MLLNSTFFKKVLRFKNKKKTSVFVFFAASGSFQSLSLYFLGNKVFIQKLNLLERYRQKAVSDFQKDLGIYKNDFRLSVNLVLCPFRVFLIKLNSPHPPPLTTPSLPLSKKAKLSGQASIQDQNGCQISQSRARKSCVSCMLSYFLCTFNCR